MMLIWVKWSYIGFHKYPKAPTVVKYLANKHRHIFNCRVALSVNSSVDRELEFHMVQSTLRTHFMAQVDDQDAGSCETQCTLIEDIVKDLYPGRSYQITVDEDGECGSTLVVS